MHVYKCLMDNNILTPIVNNLVSARCCQLVSYMLTFETLYWSIYMDEGSLTGAVFLDLAKAFDTVDHHRLILKLYSIGFFNHSIDCFKSYLKNRCQVAAVGNGHSRIALNKFSSSRLACLWQ